jgi:uncharacterized protein (TIGR04255 family)
MIRSPTTAPSVRGLRDFAEPPLNEVILSIQFGTLGNLKSAHIGLFWERLRATYPQVTEQAPIQAMFETFGTSFKERAPVHFETFLSPPLPRYWFERVGQPDLLQLQQDRILHNWRQQGDNSRVYPRYEAVKKTFEAEVSLFEAWLFEEKIGELRANQCEVTYINIVKLPNGDDAAHDRCMEKITPLWTGRFSEDPPCRLEHVQVNAVCLFPNEGKPVGRVYVKFQPAYLNTDGSHVIRLEITARGRPHGETTKDAFEFLDAAREQVVRTFAAVTTKDMHKIWGRSDG